ncbi:hypothetical protein [Micromonospora sp. MH99]|uniref:DUF7919 family protein n=1 Tax=Micromonospora sp. MH99 TaxID=1945510 RepID=UPI001F1C35C4|nr:hypothetical protein [Micromonospora sp. MH99]MCF0093665.1 hypothetical protein [Micromonospora sp. MH99]
MTYFADLTPYTYLERHEDEPGAADEPWPDLPRLNVGWLDAAHPYPTGAAPDWLMPALTALAKARVRQTRGYHYCEICIRDLGEDAREAIRQGVIARESAEFEVRGDGVVYAAPQLLLHYVAAHEYLPPAEFCTAALGATS